MSVQYVIWDWNGTLLDDTEAVVAGLNDMLARRGLPSITLEGYRDVFAFPARDFYARIGFRLEEEDWDALAREYHDAYAAHPKALNRDALPALEAVRSRGARQSILSAHEQGRLDAITRQLGVAPYMEHVFGVDNLDGASKLDRARELLSRIRAAHFPDASDVGWRTRVVVVGDAIHDKEVADALGVGCVLCAQGGHSAARLRRVAPTAETLLDAVDMIFSSSTDKT